jgi:hypothetical protein
MADRTAAPSLADEHLDIGGALHFPALAADARQAEPVTLALPLPQGALRHPADFRLLDGEAALPVQARATSQWPDGSVRWLYIRTQVDLPGRAAKDITWSVAPAAPAQQSAPQRAESAGGITVTESAAGLLVDTGRLRALVPRSGGALLQEVYLDGALVPGELGAVQLAAVPVESGEVTSPAGVPFQPESVTLEESGLVTAIIRLDGWYTPGVWQGQVRLAFHAGKPYVTVTHQFTLHDPGHRWRLRALSVDWTPTAAVATPPRLALGQGHYRTAIESGTAPRAAVLGPLAMYGQEHAPELFYGDFWASHTGPTGGAAITIYQAFQHFPVGLAATPERLRAALAPEEGEGVEIWPGMAKTHQLLVNIHGPQETLDALSFRSLQFQLPDEPVAPPQTYAAAGVWPDIFPSRRSETLEWLLSRRADERVVALGMLDFGDGPDAGYTAQRRGGDDLVWTNNEYDFAHAMYLHWARTGERRFRGSADVAARHWLDVDICHASPDPLRLGGHIMHSAHHVTGGLAPSHQWVEGLLDYYHHTGDAAALDAALGVGENILRLLAQPTFQRPGSFQVRELGWALVALAALYEETREERFLTESARLVEMFMAWRDEFGGLLAPYTSHTLVRVPFMIAVAARGLLRYHALRPDPRIPSLVVSEVDALLAEFLGPEGVFYYKGLPSLHRPHPNLLLLGLLAQAYRLTGNTHYLDVALTQLRWLLQSESSGARGSAASGKSFLRGAGLPGPKGFAQAFLPTMEFYTAAAAANRLP